MPGRGDRIWPPLSAEVLTCFLCSPAVRPMSTWASSWRRSSPTRMQPPTTSWPGSTVIMPTLPLVRKSIKVRLGAAGSRQQDHHPDPRPQGLCSGRLWDRGVLRSLGCHPPSVLSVPLDRLQTSFQLLEGQEIRGGHRSLPQCKPPALAGRAWSGGMSPARCFHTLSLSLSKVLGEHPNYPKIREEILEKAQGSLRP